MSQWFNVGKIVNTHGIRGEVRVISITDFPEQRYAPGSSLHLFLKGQQQSIPLTVHTHRIHKNFHLLSFEGYSNINDVELWKNGILKVSKSELTDLAEGQFYFHEIIGCTIFTEQGEEVGVVKEILTPGANDVWVVKGKDRKEYLIPYIKDVVKKVSVAEKQIIIDPLEGLLS